MVWDRIIFIYLITGVLSFFIATFLLYRVLLFISFLVQFLISSPLFLYCPLVLLAILVCCEAKIRIKQIQSSILKEHSKVLVMGAGFSGLCMAAKLSEAGIPFTILEAYKRIGATFRHIRRGCDCDVMPAQYQFSFFQDKDWDRLENPSTEIKNYLTNLVKQYKLCTKIKFQTEVRSATWNEQESLWTVETNNGIFTSDILISACGMLHKPKLSRTSLNKNPIPYFKGRDSFGGKSFLSKRWDQNVNIQGARLAVIGSATASLQIVPAIVARAKEIFVFQTDPISYRCSILTSLNTHFPAFVSFYKGFKLFWKHLLTEYLLYKIFESLRESSLRYQYQPHKFRRRSSVFWDIDESEEVDYCTSEDDVEIEKKVIPKYSLGTKTVLLGDEFLPQLKNNNTIHFISDPILEITEKGVKTKDGETQLDVIVYATGGVEGNTGDLPYQINGRNGLVMREEFHDSPLAYLGMTMQNFPNLFLLLGPNTVLSHDSFIFMIESQVNYVLKVIRKMEELRIVSVEPRRDVTSQYFRKMLVWTKSQFPNSCQGWYRTQETDKHTIWPKHLIEYWFVKRDENLIREYEVTFQNMEEKTSYY